MTNRDALERWLADTEWAEIGGDGSDAMRCRPQTGEGHEPGPWIRNVRRTRILEADASMVDLDAAILRAPDQRGLPRGQGDPRSEPSCPVHGPSLGGICWRCTERLGSHFTGIATIDPETGVLDFRGADPGTEPGQSPQE